MYDFAVVGAGIIGLATALELGRRFPDASVVVLEKEQACGTHQSGHNSGVIHSGIYYKPGSLKARLCRRGARSMVAFCEEQGIAHEVCGKVIVATDERELARLEGLIERGKANGLDVVRLRPANVAELEPHVRCLGGIRVADTGIVDFGGVCRKLSEMHVGRGGELRTNAKVEGISARKGGTVVQTSAGVVESRFVVNCAGLHSDRVAQLAGVEPPARIVPFRGEYYELTPESSSIVKNLVYPVPNPAFPFLGVHFTRMVDGRVQAGPNAVVSLKREGYRWRDFDLRDAVDTLSFPGFWRLARANAREGMREVARSVQKKLMVRELARMVPDIRDRDLVRSHAGVRAQAVLANGQLVDDFLIVGGENSLHVCNAPSPAATASLEIASAIVDQIPA